MKDFKEAVDKNLKTLELYVPIVARVHGAAHPEFHEVKKVFDELSPKVNQLGEENPDLDTELQELRRITDNYTVHSDVCESYEAVYHMLEEIDRAYSK